MKTGVYKRYSTEKQDMKTQSKEIADYLTYKNIKSEDCIFYSDEAVSGATDNREQYRKLIKDINDKKINCVIALQLDRLGRSTRDLQNFLYNLRENNVQLILIKENVDTNTANGKFFYDICAAFAEWERVNIVDRLKRGRKRAELEGKVCHRPKKDINVRKIIKLHDENKLSFNAIKKVLDSENLHYSVATIIKRYNEMK
jgi:DNA invertase Pin-like site-specific DNA recombinase